MSSIFLRGRRYYAEIKNDLGKWVQVRTPYLAGQEAEAEKWAREREREAERSRQAHSPGALTVAAYAAPWLDGRTNESIGDDRARMRDHVLPRIGHLLLADVRPRHARDVILALRKEGKLAARTIRQCSGLMHTMFKSAVIEEKIAANPIVFERGTLPKKVDKDPAWRAQAIFTRAEGEMLISDERLLADRRVLYALKLIALLRHGEAATLRWELWDAAAMPLGMLHINDPKNGVSRQVPVHPTLAAILAEWRLAGWAEMMGRSPQPRDLIVPSRQENVRAPAGAQVQLIEDLEKLGLRVEAGTRNRSGHNLRRTGITLARGDGAIDAWLRFISHGPRPGEMLDVYSTPPWEQLCTEMSKLRIERRQGQVIALASGAQ